MKLSITDKVKKMREVDLMKLCETHTYYKIAEVFDVCHTTVRNELLKQLKNKKEYSKENNISVVVHFSEEFTSTDYINSKNAWMNSKEREAYNNLKI